MTRLSLQELEGRCQKPGYRAIGNWMARRVTRPMALRVTWVIHPWGLSAHAATLTAWSAGIAAALAFGWGNAAGWMLGAGLLQLWYLLDHVDGHLARFHRSASLDGTQLDYLMHHTINLLAPLGVGCGIASTCLEPLWSLAGLCWGLGLMLIGLQHDARYKAFIQRLKRLHGELHVIGGGGARPGPAPGPPRGAAPCFGWLARKLCEIHVTMNLLTLLALVWLASPSNGLLATKCVLVFMASLAILVALATLARSQQRQSCEQEFCEWFRVPPGHTLELVDGWWHVRDVGDQHSPRENIVP